MTLCLPYGMRFASSGITQIHRELEEAASVSGATLGQIFLRVLFPLILPFLLAAWIYVFVLSVRELGASVFLVGPGTSVLGTVSLTMWEEGGSYGAVAALGVLQILPLLVIVAACDGWRCACSGAGKRAATNAAEERGWGPPARLAQRGLPRESSRRLPRKREEELHPVYSKMCMPWPQRSIR